MAWIILAVFLIAHGLVHLGLTAAPNPADPDTKPGAFFTTPERSWLLPRLGFNPPMVKWTGILLVALATLGFVLAALGIFGVPGLSAVWWAIAVASAGVSLLLLILFWHPWLLVGILIDVGIMVGILSILLWDRWFLVWA